MFDDPIEAVHDAPAGSQVLEVKEEENRKFPRLNLSKDTGDGKPTGLRWESCHSYDNATLYLYA